MLHSKQFQSLSSCWGWVGDLPNCSVRAQQLRKLNAFQVITKIPPGIAASMLGSSFQEQRQDSEGDVRVNAMRRPVKYGAQSQAAGGVKTFV